MGRFAIRLTVLAAAFLAAVATCATAAESIVSVYGGNDPTRALGMPNKCVAGAAALGSARVMDFIAQCDRVTQQTVWNWEYTAGTNNTGLQTRIWGTVTAVYSNPVTGARWFYVDDGSRCVSDFGDVGVLVYSDLEVQEGQFVKLTGVADVEPSMDSPDRLVRILRCVPETEYPEYPFSDEFNGPVLDPRWNNRWAYSTASLDVAPGWLALTPRFMASAAMSQEAVGNWDAEFRVRVAPAEEQAAYSGTVGLFRDPTAYASSALAAVTVQQSGRAVWALGNNVANSEAGDGSCWFRVRRRFPDIGVNFSWDGVNWLSSEYVQQVPEACVLVIGARSDSSGTTAYFDYFRITKVDDMGGLQ